MSRYTASCAALSCSVCLTLCDCMDYSLSGSSIHGESPGKYWSKSPWPLPGDLANIRTEPRPLTLQVDSFPFESPRKPKNTGVGSLSLLHGIFLTYKSNQGLLLAGRFFTSRDTRETPKIHWSEVKSLSHVRLFVIPWTVAYQAPPSMGFSRQEYWSGVPFPSH